MLQDFFSCMEGPSSCCSVTGGNNYPPPIRTLSHQWHRRLTVSTSTRIAFTLVFITPPSSFENELNASRVS